MAEMIELKEQEERVILVAVSTGEDDDTAASVDELEELASTAGAVTVGKVIQNRENVHPGTYLGKGKIEEVKELLWELDATGIICDDELSPAQLKNLEDALDTKVMDRTMVILDIFASRARTREGKIQVELAQLRYRAVRLVGLRNSLSRLGGGIGTRGPGEKKLEVDRRLIHERISQLKSELEDVKRHREVVRKKRENGGALTAAIVGYTNAGKSTLLNTLGCLDTPTSGEYLLDGISVRTMSKPQRAVLRNRKIGFVFQSYNLLPKTTAVENVELPLMYNSAVSASERRRRAIESLQAVGLGDRLEHKSNQMSGGQMQRVAIARALVNNPAVILADEATGNLDTRTSFEILVLFQKLHAEGRTIIFVTHNPEIAQYSSRNIVLRDGRVKDDTVNPDILNAAETLAALPKQEDD